MNQKPFLHIILPLFILVFLMLGILTAIFFLVLSFRSQITENIVEKPISSSSFVGSSSSEMSDYSSSTSVIQSSSFSSVTMDKPMVTKIDKNTFEVRAVYYYNPDKGYCSGVVDKDKIVTILHCVEDGFITDEKVVEIDLEDYLLVIDKTYRFTTEEGVYYLATVDNGIAKARPESPNKCADCGNLFLVSETPIGGGNSGTAVFDWNGEFVGSLSGTVFQDDSPNSFDCDPIIGDRLRRCAYIVRIREK